MVLAKWALPFPSYVGPTQPVLEHALGGSTTLFAAPAGYVLTSRLAGLIQERQSPAVWLRVGPEDRDPAALLVSLVNGVEAAFPGLGRQAFERMRQRPGPVFGWAPLYSELARDLSEAAHSDGHHPPLALVIQHINALYETPATLSLLKDIFLPQLPPGASSILTSHVPPPRGMLPGYGVQRTTQELRLEEGEAWSLAQDCLLSVGKTAGNGTLSFPLTSLRRLISLSDGCGVALSGICLAYPMLGGRVLQNLVESANNRVDLMARIARCCVQSAPRTIPDLMSLALRLEYMDKPTVQAALGMLPEEDFDLPPGWLQPLVGGWMRLRCVWHEPLRQVLRPSESGSRQALKRAAEHLGRTGAADQAIPLLLDLGCEQEAAQAIQQVAEPMMDLGQWETLSGWLARLPERVRRDWPWLVYTEGELAAARGQSRSAQRIFASTTRAFTHRDDPIGAGQSLLNESILAARQNDLARAEDLAKQASAVAGQAGLGWLQGWAGWQLACLSACAGKIDDAAAYLASAASVSAPNTRLASFIDETRGLVQALADMRRQMLAHRQAAEEAALAGREAADRLRFFLQNPSDQANELLEQYGWSKVPLSIKMPGTYAPPGLADFDPAQNPPTGAERLVDLVRSLLQLPKASAGSAPAASAAASVPPVVQTPASKAPEPPALPIQHTSTSAPTEQSRNSEPVRLPLLLPVSGGDASKPPVQSTPEPPITAERPAAAEQVKKLSSHSETASPPVWQLAPSYVPGGAHTLNAYLLGKFRVTLDDMVLSSWPSGRSRSAFAFLLAQRGEPVQRDLLMETFWPESSPESARNNLNVAIYSLRHTLKNALDFPLILLEENAYRINPEVHVWVDVEDFEVRVHAARQMEVAALTPVDTRSSINEYEAAVSLYHGDFLSDAPYEDWTALERERLRVLYLDTLDHLSLVYFNNGQYAESINLCQRMLSHDASREDAHCRLMRCFTRQGQLHLALRQYQACVEALRSEMDVSPAPSTVQLYEQIRRREMV